MKQPKVSIDGEIIPVFSLAFSEGKLSHFSVNRGEDTVTYFSDRDGTKWHTTRNTNHEVEFLD